MTNRLIMPEQKFRIAWERFDDPLLNKDNDEDGDESSTYEKQEKQKVFKALVTNFGPISVPELTPGAKALNLWTIHTNFNISNQIADIINEADGIEALVILTRYRARIGIGKMFSDDRVRSNLNGLLLQHLNNDN